MYFLLEVWLLIDTEYQRERKHFNVIYSP